MHEVLVNRLGGLSLPWKSVLRLTDRPDTNLDVYRGRKTTTQQQIHRGGLMVIIWSCVSIRCMVISMGYTEANFCFKYFTLFCDMYHFSRPQRLFDGNTKIHALVKESFTKFKLTSIQFTQYIETRKKIDLAPNLQYASQGTDSSMVSSVRRG